MITPCVRLLSCYFYTDDIHKNVGVAPKQIATVYTFARKKSLISKKTSTLRRRLVHLSRNDRVFISSPIHRADILIKRPDHLFGFKCQGSIAYFYMHHVLGTEFPLQDQL